MSLVKQLIRDKDKAMDKAKAKGTKKFKDPKKWQVNAKSFENKTVVFFRRNIFIKRITGSYQVMIIYIKFAFYVIDLGFRSFNISIF